MSSRRTRVNMRIPEDLTSWAKNYAASRGKSFTQLVVDLLVATKDEESASPSHHRNP